MKTRSLRGMVILWLMSAVIFFHLSACKKNHDDHLLALPESASMAVEFSTASHLDTFLLQHPSGTVQALRRMVFFKHLTHDFQLLTRIFSTSVSTLGEHLSRASLLCGISFNAPESQRAVFIFSFSQDILLAENIRKIDSKKVKVFPTQFKGSPVFTLHLPDNQRVALAQYEKLLIYSAVPYLVEESLAALRKGKNDWKPFAHFGSSPVRLMLLNPKIMAQLERQFLPRFRHIARWIAENVPYFELQIDADTVRVAAHLPSLLNPRWQTGATAREPFFAIVPNHAACVLWMSADNRQPFLQKLNLSENTDFQYFIASWMAEDAAFVLTHPFSTNLMEEQFFVVGIRDAALAHQRLDEFARRYGSLRNYDYQSFRIRQFMRGQVLLPFLRDEGEGFDRPACVQLGDFMVFGRTTAALEIWVDKYIVSQNLMADIDFLQLNQQLPPNGQHLFYLNTQMLPSICQRLFSGNLYTENAKAATAAGLIAVDISDGKIQLFEQKHAPALPQPGILWKTELATPVITRPCPAFFRTHEPPAGIFVQDARYQLYCLKPNGEVAWRRYLDGQLRSAVHCLDYFQNGKPCFLLSTPQKVYILDENGKDVEGYPLALRAAASGGVQLVNFGAPTDYAYFIACQNGNVYGFDAHGIPLPGWNPKGVEGRIQHPIVHFQHENKDYLSLLTHNGKLYVWGRDGTLRFPVVQLAGTYDVPLQVDYHAPNAPRLVAANRAGEVNIIHLQGQTISLPAGGSTAFVLSEVAGDTRKDYAALSGDVLVVKGYRSDGKFDTFFSKRYPVPQDTLFEIPTGNPVSWLGSFSRRHRQIFLVNGRGFLLPNFPMSGTTPFTVAQLSPRQEGLTLLVGLDNQVFAYFLGK